METTKLVATVQPNTPENSQTKVEFRLPLWAVLVLPFIVIIVGTVISVHYLSYRNSQIVVDETVGQLLNEINTRIETQVESFLEIPQTINLSNANVIQHNHLDISDIEEVGHYFWEQVQLYDTVSSIYWGNPEGGLVSGGREGTDNSLYIITTDNFESGPLNKYATDSSGDFADLIVRVPQFDARIRPWYIGTLENNSAYWTEPYVLSTGQDLAIASSLPVYNHADELLGVVSIDLFISQINDFLQEIDIGKTGQTYIVEHSGLLIATSSDTPTILQSDDESWARISAFDSTDPTIAASSEYITNELGGFSDFDESVQQSIRIDGKNHYLWVSSFHNVEGLDWLIVTIIPKSDFLGAIEDQNRVAFLLTTVAIIIAVAAAIITAFYISRPITQLSATATRLATGKLSETVPIKGVEEVRRLGRAFNSMSAQLYELFNELEDRVQERTAELAKSEARYRGIVEDQTELICRFSPDNKLTFVNKAYCRYYDKTESQLIGHSFMPMLPEEDQIYLEKQLAQLSPTQQTIKVEHRVIVPNNQMHCVQWVNRAIFDETQEFIEIQAVGRDITERKQHEETLQKALARETELNELKSDFITTVSHEFRTPMTIILNSSEILERYDGRLSPEKKTEHFQRIRGQIQHMTHLLEDVLTVHQSETGTQDLNPQILNLIALCQSVISDLETTAHNITFDFEFTETCKSVRLDEKYVRLIVTNILSNAVKYSSSGGEVKVQLDCDIEHILFSVTDKGIGIPESVQPHIFEPFYRANNVETISGTGLGLTIVKKCVERHHGTISFTSTLDAGTTFTVRLPNIDAKEHPNEDNSGN